MIQAEQTTREAMKTHVEQTGCTNCPVCRVPRMLLGVIDNQRRLLRDVRSVLTIQPDLVLDDRTQERGDGTLNELMPRLADAIGDKVHLSPESNGGA